MSSSRFWRRASVGLGVAAGLALLPMTGTAAQQQGGTIKIGPDDEGTPNAPHQGCVFLIEFAGFDETVGEANVTVTVVPPSSNPAAVIVNDTFQPDNNDPAGGAGDFDGSVEYDVGAALNADFVPNENQGFHVRVDVDFEPGPPTDGSKTFWVTCAPVPPPPPPPPPPPGDQPTPDPEVTVESTALPRTGSSDGTVVLLVVAALLIGLGSTATYTAGWLVRPFGAHSARGRRRSPAHARR